MRSGGRRVGKTDEIFATEKPLILASRSPRRQQYFHDLGLIFKVRSADVVETLLPDEGPEGFVLRMAEEKAVAVMNVAPENWVVAADTVVIIDDFILGKPKDQEDAVAMLMRLAGRDHDVRTGFCVGCSQENLRTIESVVTKVRFADFSENIAKAYVATGEPLDKAGAYGIQGRGAFLVETVSGSYSNVVGLPLHQVVTALCRYGVIGPLRCADCYLSKKIRYDGTLN
jgi:septum formation protein